MKNSIYKWVAVLALFSLGSCENWLDVSPRTQVRQDILFSTEEGFMEALNGVYIDLTSEKLYGMNMTFVIPEYMAHHWQRPVNQTAEQFLYDFRFDVDASKNTCNDSWLRFYTNIAQLNDILDHLGSTDILFRYNNDKFVRGEAYGLRAFLHFEVLRFWGPVPVNPDPTEKAIPYVSALTKETEKLKLLPYKDVLDSIRMDLDRAEEILSQYDPIVKYSNDQLNSPANAGSGLLLEEWQYYRQNRLNYYAVLALKARFYHWIGEKEQAAKYAKEVIDASNNNELRKFPLATEDDFINSNTQYTRNLVMSNEHIFSLHILKLQERLNNKLPVYDNTVTFMVQDESVADIAFEEGLHPDDIRYKTSRNWREMISSSGTRYVLQKFLTNDTYTSPNLVPLLRVAEMYLIYMENVSLEEARKYFSLYRIARSLSQDVENEITDERSLLERLEKEYRKEFYGEGQMYYFYKRHNILSYTYPDPFSLPAAAYKIPLPEDQVVFED